MSIYIYIYTNTKVHSNMSIYIYTNTKVHSNMSIYITPVMSCTSVPVIKSYDYDYNYTSSKFLYINIIIIKHLKGEKAIYILMYPIYLYVHCIYPIWILSKLDPDEHAYIIV